MTLGATHFVGTGARRGMPAVAAARSASATSSTGRTGAGEGFIAR